MVFFRRYVVRDPLSIQALVSRDVGGNATNEVSAAFVLSDNVAAISR